jgi:hypothetical protein
LATIDPVPPVTASRKKPQAVRPVNTKIAKDGMPLAAPRNWPMTMK